MVCALNSSCAIRATPIRTSPSKKNAGKHFKKWSLGVYVHVHNTPGVEHHVQADKFVIKPGHPLYEKRKKLFKGVKQ